MLPKDFIFEKHKIHILTLNVPMCNCLEEIVFKEINEISCTSFARSRNFQKTTCGLLCFCKTCKCELKRHAPF